MAVQYILIQHSCFEKNVYRRDAASVIVSVKPEVSNFFSSCLLTFVLETHFQKCLKFEHY